MSLCLETMPEFLSTLRESLSLIPSPQLGQGLKGKRARAALLPGCGCFIVYPFVFLLEMKSFMVQLYFSGFLFSLSIRFDRLSF